MYLNKLLQDIKYNCDNVSSPSYELDLVFITFFLQIIHKLPALNIF